MTRGAEVIDPNSTIRDAARKMRADNIGALPVGDRAGEVEAGGSGHRAGCVHDARRPGMEKRAAALFQRRSTRIQRLG
jgi:CBS domain-containing protein